MAGRCINRSPVVSIRRVRVFSGLLGHPSIAGVTVWVTSIAVVPSGGFAVEDWLKLTRSVAMASAAFTWIVAAIARLPPAIPPLPATGVLVVGQFGPGPAANAGHTMPTMLRGAGDDDGAGAGQHPGLELHVWFPSRNIAVRRISQAFAWVGSNEICPGKPALRYARMRECRSFPLPG